MSGGRARRGGLGSFMASSNYTKKRAPRDGCREFGGPLASGLHGATLVARAAAGLQPLDQGLCWLGRRGGRLPDRGPMLSDPDVPYSVGEDVGHYAPPRLPVR